MVKRIKDGDVYRFDPKFLEENHIYEYRKNSKNLKNLQWLQNKNKNFGNFDENLQEQIDELSKTQKNIRHKIETVLKDKAHNKRNILRQSSLLDKWIGKWKDSSVFAMKNNDKYVYKEAHNGTLDTMLYLKFKYLILKKYLGDIIPKSYFIFWESSSGDWKKDEFKTKIITMQEKVSGKNLQKMSDAEKEDSEMLKKLGKAHKKYTLLKLYLENIIETLDLPPKSMDLQLDLWILSDAETFPDNKKEVMKIKSPNIMWDGNKIHFIDFGAGEWDDNKQKIFDYMMRDDVYQDWINASKAFTS